MNSSVKSFVPNVSDFPDADEDADVLELVVPPPAADDDEDELELLRLRWTIFDNKNPRHELSLRMRQLNELVRDG